MKKLKATNERIKAKNGETEKTKQIIQDIAKKGMIIYQTLQSINEENKIIRAKALAEKHVQKINILILQAKELGLDNSISKLESSKTHLMAANNTAQIKHSIKIIITLQNEIEKSISLEDWGLVEVLGLSEPRAPLSQIKIISFI